METLIFRPSILSLKLSTTCEGKIKILTSATSAIWCLVWSGVCGVLRMEMSSCVSGHMKEICQRKGADVLSRPENIQTSPHNSNTFIRWGSKDASKDAGGQKMGRKVEPGDQTSLPAYSGGNVDDIANGTSHITLEHPDIQMADASVQARLVNRKRNGPDSATGGGPPTPTHNTPRES
ncbi:hypothetical protein B9Z19DRAFT_331721 [Tuber borchii]|uniref:Uncharacterized protein n=1 Tax=Tuber borchii TaxID=42251 RepID=A0A2T6ZJC5_TUBBO|nr:hypothetical protein B9Z19DRAFT_331721 [Tuber borchii]